MNKREFMQAYVLARASVAPNGFDPSVRDGAVDVAGRVYDAIVAATPDHADEGWIEHRGEKPYPEGRVEWVNRHGSTGTDDSDDLIWSHDGDPWDIVKWRPA